MPRTLKAQVASAIRAEMERQEVTQLTLALRLKVSQTWVNRRLQGHIAVDTEEMERIAKALGVPVTTFLEGRRPA